ncbi:tape measure protein [Mediterranea massiliensis]|uniref:tape measure protein n=1 Tax=Mediterranea massiliensis TaxID=1841865 RepID=UPI0025A4B3DA|nr:tape measure protein [Mediterranea massiliensis]MDM8338076.1 tape measure protein [Mediterranea massiliensis]
MSDKERLAYAITLDTAQLEASAKKASNEFKSMGGNIENESRRIDSAMRTIGTAAAAYFSVTALTNFARSVIQVRGEIESLEISFSTLLGSTDKAKELFGAIRDFEVKTPMTLEPLAKGAQTLLGFGVAAEKVMPILKQIGDISMGNADRFQSLVLAFAQASANGKLMGQDLLQMINAGFNPLNQMSKDTGKSIAELRDEMSKGAISAEDMERAFASATAEGGQFYGMLEKQSEGINGALSNLEGAWNSMLNEIGSSQQSVFVSGVNLLTNMVEHYDVFLNAILSVAAAYGTYKAALMAVWVVEKARNLTESIRLIMMFRKELGLLTAAQQAFNITAWANPYVLLAAAIIGVVTALVLYTDSTSNAEKAQEKLNEDSDAYRQKLEEERQAIDECINVIRDKTETDYSQIAAYERLKKLCPEITNAYTMQELAAADLSETTKRLNEIQDEETYQHKIDELNKYKTLLDDIKQADEDWTKLSEQNANLLREEFGTGLLENKQEQVQIIVDSLQKDVDEIERIRKEAEYAALPLDTKLELAIDERDSIRKEFDRVKKKVEEQQRKTENSLGIWNVDIFLNMRFRNLQGSLKDADAKVSALQAQKNAQTTFQQDYDSARKEWEKAKSELDKINRERSKYTSDQYKKAKETYDAAEKAYKDLGGDTKENTNLKKQAEERKKLLEDIAKQRKQLLADASDAEISALQDGLKKRLREIENQRKQTISAIDQEEAELSQKLGKLGQTLSESDRKAFQTQRDAANATATNETREAEEENAEYIKGLYENLADVFVSEEQRKVNAIKRTYQEQRKQLSKDLAGGNITQDQYNDLSGKINAAEGQELEDYWLSAYGNYYQKREQLQEDWESRLALIPAKYQAEANRLYLEELSKLDIDQFKKNINWDSVFGDLSKQSLSSLQHTLGQVQSMFDANKGNMDVTEIRDMQEAIKSIEDEIANRNPFTGLIKAMKDIGDAKDMVVTSLNEYKDAQIELTAAQEQYNLAIQAQQELDALVQDGKTSKDTEEYAQAVENVTNATNRLTSAETRSKNAEQGVLTARNNLTTSYKTFANQLNNVKGVIDSVGGHAKNLADVFSDEVGTGIGKAIDFIDEVLDATSTVISAIGDVGKNVASAMSSTVSAASTGMQASATAAAASISTVEKASVILAVISAALHIATAIAGLFNNDEEYQEEIERLQGRIDQLQWELDNADVVRMQDNSFDSLQKLQDVVRETTAEVLKLHNATAYYYSGFYRMIGPALYQSEIYQKSIEKIADAYADIEYSADKALGAEKYESSRSQLENLAEQQLAIQQQINAESSKKDSDSGKIEEWKRDIQEIGQEMVAVINEMVEDIIGGSAADIAEQLGDAFFDAFREGEDAAKAWKDTVDDIVSDIVKRMLVTELLEKPIGQLFDRYKTKWFGDDGTFKGIDAINNSMGAFANELYGLVNIFSEGMEGLPDELKDIILGDAETTREGTQKGIATASQESVDENNARLTTIQGHTYSIMTGVVELNRIGNLVLERLMGIENNTAETNTRLDNLDKRVSKVSSTLNDIQLKGLRIQR